MPTSRVIRGIVNELLSMNGYLVTIIHAHYITCYRIDDVRCIYQIYFNIRFVLNKIK